MCPGFYSETQVGDVPKVYGLSSKLYMESFSKRILNQGPWIDFVRGKSFLFVFTFSITLYKITFLYWQKGCTSWRVTVLKHICKMTINGEIHVIQ